MGDLFINLDLNQEPVVYPSPPSPPASFPQGFESFLNVHETPIEDRIRFAIRVSSRHPQPSMTSAIAPIVGEKLKNHKRDKTHLAKALEMDVDANKTDGVLFGCNICLGLAKDPILTCCGHLFCWGCFYQVPYVDSVSKDCPACNGEVTDSNVTPVYGSGNVRNSQLLESSSRIRIPPRPHARRVKSVGQRSLVHNAVVHASVDIRSENRRYGDVEIDPAVSSRRRRRLR